MGKIRLATTFSGIGAIEWAFKRLGINHNIVLACDNGDIEIDVDTDAELEKIRKLSNAKEKRLYVENLYHTLSRRKNFVEVTYKANYKVEGDNFFYDVKLLDGTDFKNKVDL